MVSSKSIWLQNSPAINICVTSEQREETGTQPLYIAFCLENMEIRAETHQKPNCCFLHQYQQHLGTLRRLTLI